LRSLGASIDYAGVPGYPPLRITGKSLKGGEVTIDVSVSSQFVSALLLIAPYLPQGLTIRMNGEQVSFPYVEMTLRLMEDFGVLVKRDGDSLIVTPGNYHSKTIPPDGYTVEADWSAAAFWYEAVALSSQAEIRIPGLHKNSIQGDAVVADLFRPLGVETTFDEEGVVLTKAQGSGLRAQGSVGRAQSSINTLRPSSLDPRPSNLDPESSTLDPVPSTLNLSSFPDLAPPLIVTCAALGIPAYFTGLDHLKIKESDRVKALGRELNRLGISIRHHCHNENSGYPGDEAAASLSLQESRVNRRRSSGVIETVKDKPLEHLSSDHSQMLVQTYGDHRIAMAFAPLALKTGTICIADPSVVAKSYPGFWAELKRTGFIINEHE
ncbi:MAG: hypothetical protein HQ542_00110, partial [Bacteroidia bacterium]|nr:hypothetical protein [Bacteroidia bacterium]